MLKMQAWIDHISVERSIHYSKLLYLRNNDILNIQNTIFISTVQSSHSAESQGSNGIDIEYGQRHSVGEPFPGIYSSLQNIYHSK